ncbi:hypothetical protein MmiAt1_10510 [Methanimicrococcus sp. At1]|uniref:GLUG domain-containing protein n=1 Tax=Methanimicrococcus hacksteinii TaxID=3028293 RepID=A0ABU3VQ01_9EURY|nr:GLUG motif-containing protein [Methanimicrococcus sp. At1]MDV0445471.1 hypothetical protein [Methanimicrococcus sp. At1]
MKIIKSFSLMTIFLIAFVLMSGIAAAVPIDIGTAGELGKIGNDVNFPLDGNYILTDNISLADVTWVPIGSESDPFTGTFEGGVFTISNLTVDLSGTDNVGLFGAADGASFLNISLIDVNVTGSNNVGSLVGNVSDSTFENCSVPRSIYVIAENDNAGGFAGYASDVDIINCSVSSIGWVQAENNAGGLVGSFYGGNAESCSFSDFILVSADNDNAGGIAGYAENADFTDCFVFGYTGIYAENNNAGGLVGYADSCAFDSCSVYIFFYVTADNNAGGLVGDFTGSIINCYSAADVEAANSAGGVVGYGYEGSPSICDISSSYFSGFVSFGYGADSNSKIGGIIGSYTGTPTVVDCIYLDDSVDTGDIDAVPTLLGTVVSFADINVIPISSESDLKKIGSNEYDAVNDYWYTMNANYVLVKDIEITENWTPLGKYGNYFTGTFEGSGHTISDLTIDLPDTSYIGLFGAADGASFSNISLVDVNIAGNKSVGSLVGNVWDSDFINCSVSGDVSVTAENDCAGGLVGSAESYGTIANITNCSVSGIVSVIAENDAGGFVGSISGNISVTNCSVSGLLNAEADSNIGGFAGSVYNAVFTNCSVSGPLFATAESDNAGGFAGYAEDADFADCSVLIYGFVTADGDCAGGLIGFVESDDTIVSITNCSVSGAVSVTAEDSFAGGLVGLVMLGTFDGCSVSGDISVTAAEMAAGGLIGAVFLSSATVTNCFVSGDISVTAEGEFAGGLAGSVWEADFTSCFVSGNVKVISEGESAGGLAGSVWEADFTSCSVSEGVFVTADGDCAGGLVGEFDGSIKDCYSMAQVKANDYAGGLVGYSWDSSTEMKSSYFAGSVESGTNFGGIIGDWSDEPIIADCVYSDTAGTEFTNSLGTPVSPVNMKKIATYQTPNVVTNWNITPSYDPEHVWYISEGKTYPLLSAHYVPPVKSNGGPGFGGENVRIIDPVSETSEQPPAVNQTPVVNQPQDVGSTPDPGFAEPEAKETDRTLYFIIGIGFIAVIGGAVYLIGKSGMIALK